ncbi:hypothetical protein SAMN05216421_3260 [Halopseudomonas xinjiangensis]|uniref:Flagellin n=1 Tax=Halopseudomonas xinjiangensis TaxID=487184 RepID=A0A1H1YU26_9GAMM|nr:hypothetical protein [Halopseudomonas xinjiangensis]SDT24526.1 hypothetical protein SAMN05216421_3260 [Halopseudomonas xinjiangensis]
MKIDKQLPVVTAIDPQGHSRAEGHRALAGESQSKLPGATEQSARYREGGKHSGYNLQLNRQLTAMQSADSYLADVAARLDQVKLALSRQLATPTADAQPALREAIAVLESMLAERSKRSAGSLDANLRLSLNEPARTRFRLPGLDSLERLQAVQETLIIKAGRRQSEPGVVVLERGVHPEQILRRFNEALAPAGVRTELDSDGKVVFSSRETDWLRLQNGIAVQGQGELFEPDRYSLVSPQQESFLTLGEDLKLETSQQQRSMLDTVVKALDRIALLRDQLNQRKQEIREFLSRQSGQNDQQWAADYVQSVFGLMQKATSNYAAVTQTVVAQANLNRFAVVSLLS